MEKLAGTPKTECGQRKRNRAAERGGEHYGEKNRSKEVRRDRMFKKKKRNALSLFEMFAVNNLVYFCSACSASNSHVYLMLMSM